MRDPVVVRSIRTDASTVVPNTLSYRLESLLLSEIEEALAIF